MCNNPMSPCVIRVAPILMAAGLIVLSAGADDAFTEGRRLLDEGKEVDAFRRFLAVPGAEHMAARVARLKAAEFLPLLTDPAIGIPAYRVKLIEGDLCLSLARNAEALACYNEAASGIATADGGGYCVEPPVSSGEADGYGRYSQPLAPFTVGPGSHRDNWLIRRFIALKAWDSARREFDRIWQVHRVNTRPFVLATFGVAAEGKPAETNRVVVTPAGFDGKGLQFAIDYAYFLRRLGETNAAINVLIEPVLTMDMDRNPSNQRREPLAAGAKSPFAERVDPRGMASAQFWMWRGFSAGIARKEFLRLAYGEFKASGRAEQLVGAIEDRIAAGENRARRVLARVRLHEGRIDEALALELAYIDTAAFDPLTAAYRRGTAYEDAARLAEAAAEYEKALALPGTEIILPDPDEEASQHLFMQQASAQMHLSGLRAPHGAIALQHDILGRLQRLYAALGRTERAMELSLRQLEMDDTACDNLERIEQTVARFRAAGQEARIMAWIKQRAAAATSLRARANLSWASGDTPGTLRALADQAKDTKSEDRDDFDPWKERFRQAGKGAFVALLGALVEANPADAVTRLELLDATGKSDGDTVIRFLEALLESDALPAFPRGKGAWNRTQFRNYYDLAYRLMRLYEQAPGREARLLALGFRILDGEKPFERKKDILADYRADWNDGLSDNDSPAPDILNGLYVFLAHLKKPEDIERAAGAIEKTGSIPLLNQVNRLRKDRSRPRVEPVTGHEAAYATVEVLTPGLADGVRILANRDDVRAIAPGARWGDAGGEPGRVWIGTSWGLVRYREMVYATRSLQILQIPTGAGVMTFAGTPVALFVGTRDGLYRLDDPDGDVPRLVRVSIEAVDGKKRDRVERTHMRDGTIHEDRIHDAFPVDQLLWWKQALWMASRGEIYRYDPATRGARHFGDQGGGLLEGCGRLWAPQSVYDPESEEFRRIDTDVRQWQIIGATDREIWADAWVNDRLRHRPAVLDPRTLKLKVLPIIDPTRSRELQNGEFSLLGEHEGRVWLAGQNPAIVVVYDRATGALKTHLGPLPETAGWIAPDRAQQALAAVKLDLRGDRGPRLCAVPLPGKRLLVGNAIVREWAEDNLGYDDNDGMSHHVQDLEGGLFEVDPAAGTWRKIGVPEESLSDFYVKKWVRDGARLYVCTSGGLTLMSLPEGKVIGRITVSDGLPSNKVEDAVRIGDRLYIACELGDENGGLAVQDLQTGLIQVLTIADGLKSNKIKALRAEGARLHILYGTLYGTRTYGTPKEDAVVAPVAEEVKRRWTHASTDDRVLTFRSSILDTKTGRLTDGDTVLPAAFPPETLDSPLPILGGYSLYRDREAIVADPEHPKFIAGTHGLVMITKSVDEASLTVTRPREEVTVVQSRRQKQYLEGVQRLMDVSTLPNLQKALADPNPFYQARAVASLVGREAIAAQCVPVLVRLLDNAEPRVRSTALYVLSRLPLQEGVLAAMHKTLESEDAQLRALAAITLCRHGQLPALGRLREVLETGDYGNWPFGPSSTVGVVAGREALYTAVAPFATAEVFGMLMEFPPAVHDYDHETQVFPQLGDSLRRHPESAPLLLAAYDAGAGNTAGRDFAQNVFRFAGKDLLPILHRALTDKDRVIRSNAARACGAMGDPSSVKPLIAALDLESGLARASIVWALGELKAQEALPALATLYADARNDEKRRRGSGFLAAQSQAEVRAQYDAISNLDALSGDWDELTESALTPPVDPQRNEELLSPRAILDAVAKIGPAAAQAFYRALAGEKDIEARVEAAARLCECSPEDVEENVTILKNLLADTAVAVRIPAAVSLLLLAQDSARPSILAWLDTGERWEKRGILMELRRVIDPACLEFARPALAAAANATDNDGETKKLAKALLK
jgi:HEAT repeat protein